MNIFSYLSWIKMSQEPKDKLFEAIQSELAKITDNFKEYHSKIISIVWILKNQKISLNTRAIIRIIVDYL